MSCNYIYWFYILAPWIWLVVLLNYLCFIFCKNYKSHPLYFLTEWPGCYLYRLAKHLQPNQKLCLNNDGRSNKYQSGEVFEAAFTSNGRKQLQGNISYYWDFSMSWFMDNFFTVFSQFWVPFCNCKQLARQLLVCFTIHFLMKKCFKLLKLLASPVKNVLVKILVQAQIQTSCLSEWYSNLPCIPKEISN